MAHYNRHSSAKPLFIDEPTTTTARAPLSEDRGNERLFKGAATVRSVLTWGAVCLALAAIMTAGFAIYLVSGGSIGLGDLPVAF